MYIEQYLPASKEKLSSALYGKAILSIFLLFLTVALYGTWGVNAVSAQVPPLGFSESFAIPERVESSEYMGAYQPNDALENSYRVEGPGPSDFALEGDSGWPEEEQCVDSLSDEEHEDERRTFWFGCDMFGNREDLRRMITGLEYMIRDFQIIETRSNPAIKSDKFASIDDLTAMMKLFEGSNNFNDTSLQTLYQALTYWSQPDAFEWLASMYPDTPSDLKWISLNDLKWMYTRLVILLAKCEPQAPVIAGKRCCLCTYSIEDENFCQKVPVRNCSGNHAGCSVGSDGQCHTIGYNKCHEWKAVKRLRGNCSEFVVRPFNWTKVYEIPHPIHEFARCESFADVHVGHSNHEYLTENLPWKLILTLGVSPGATSYSFWNKGCLTFTDGKCDIRPWHWIEQIRKLMEDAKLDNLKIDLTGNQALMLFSNDPKEYELQCTPLTINVTAINGDITKDVKYSSCGDFVDRPCSPEDLGQLAKCHDVRDPKVIRQVRCAKVASPVTPQWLAVGNTFWQYTP